VIYRLGYKLLYDGADVRDRVATRIYAGQAPGGVAGEHIVMKVVGSQIHNHLTNEAAIGERMLQVSFFADTAVKAESGFELVRLRMSGFDDELEMLDPAGETRNYSIQANLVAANDQVSSPQDASDRWAHQHSGDFQVFFEQDVPTHV
jgi:hypothetical protein